ncbi:MAG TPA: CDP-diacylglycerol--serine O-phosphatidyltransferase [Epsilonproteobacteria bacterium]|nr:CDP-diacylglycerol--serine O-phosphatidyltransferase [Campylobacterota bacterium]
MKPRVAYILPNLFTVMSIFIGIVSITKASQEKFTLAAWLIFLALLFDGLDGRVARATGTTSRFGAELDSLADIVSFGVAPALLLYFFAGDEYGKFGLLVSALFVIFGALRLARFNSTLQMGDPNVFVGLPIPMAAVSVSVGVLFVQSYQLSHDYSFLLLVTSLAFAILMVSHIRYPAFKTISLNEKFFYRYLVILSIVASLVFLFRVEGLAILILSYICFGPIRAIYHLTAKKFH